MPRNDPGPDCPECGGPTHRIQPDDDAFACDDVGSCGWHDEEDACDRCGHLTDDTCRSGECIRIRGHRS